MGSCAGNRLLEKGRHHQVRAPTPTTEEQKQSSQRRFHVGPCQNTLHNRRVMDACSSTRGDCPPVLSVERCKECFLITVNKAGKILFITQTGEQPASSGCRRRCNCAGVTQHTLPTSTGGAGATTHEHRSRQQPGEATRATAYGQFCHAHGSAGEPDQAREMELPGLRQAQCRGRPVDRHKRKQYYAVSRR